jgi:hypothetical protein
MCILISHKVSNKSKYKIKAVKNRNNNSILKIMKINMNSQLRKKQTKNLKIKRSKNLLWT